MAVIMIQEHKTVKKPLRSFEFIQRKTKTELSSLQSEDFPIQWYLCLKNHSVPKSEVTSTILPLNILAKAALSLRGANDDDFHFPKLLVNGFEILEYKSFNKKLAREVGVGLHLATNVTYMRLFNMNITEPDTMLTTLKLVKSQSEQVGQEYTNDQQLFKIVSQITWYMPVERFLPNSWWHAYFC